VEEAVEKALEQLGAGRNDVEVTVTKKGKTGILRVGTKEATVRVKRISSSTVPPRKEVETAIRSDKEEATAVAQNLIAELLHLLRLEATVDILEPLSEEEALSFDIKGDDLGVLIGRRGQTLASFQYIVRLMVAQRLSSWMSLTVDVEGYKKRRIESLHSLALQLADRVSSNGQSMTMEPMPADERRVVHLALTDHPDVTTQSMGEGEGRKVAILPKRE
jgi:spoIIIJ-associated protein